MKAPFPEKIHIRIPANSMTIFWLLLSAARCFCQAGVGDYGNGPMTTFDFVATGL